MDSIDLQGKKYISSKRAAKITGYAQDYVGQLARGEKIPATRVGRSWYVSERDILEHAGKLPSETVKLGQEATESHSLSTGVSQGKRTLHSLQNAPRGDSFKTWSSIQYLSDESDLIPSSVKTEEKAIDQKAEISSKNIAIPLRRIHSKTLPSSSPIERSIDGLEMRSKKTEKLEINKIALKQKRTVAFVGMSAVAVALLLVTSLVGSLAISSEWTVGSQLGTAYNADFSVLFDTFYFIFSEGIKAITDFFNILLASLDIFFTSGLDFILNLLNIG